MRRVHVPEGAAKRVADGGDKRREERLQDKRILQRQVIDCSLLSLKIVLTKRSSQQSLCIEVCLSDSGEGLDIVFARVQINRSNISRIGI